MDTRDELLAIMLILLMQSIFAIVITFDVKDIKGEIYDRSKIH